VTADLDHWLAEAESRPYMSFIVNMTIRVSATSTFETDEATPGSPLLAP
jgi:hypothetical protein